MTTPEVRGEGRLLDMVIDLDECERLLIRLGFKDGVQNCEGFLSTMWKLEKRGLVNGSGVSCCLTMDGYCLREFMENPRQYGL